MALPIVFFPEVSFRFLYVSLSATAVGYALILERLRLVPSAASWGRVLVLAW